MNFGSVIEKGVKELWKEMNQLMGIPKIGCFAQRVNKQVYEKAQGKLSLCKEESINICHTCISDKFPIYYRNLQ